MLGGDDVLIVCRAALALPLVVELCRSLDQIQKTAKGADKDAAKQGVLTLGDRGGARQAVDPVSSAPQRG